MKRRGLKDLSDAWQLWIIGISVFWACTSVSILLTNFEFSLKFFFYGLLSAAWVFLIAVPFMEEEPKKEA